MLQDIINILQKLSHEHWFWKVIFFLPLSFIGIYGFIVIFPVMLIDFGLGVFKAICKKEVVAEKARSGGIKAGLFLTFLYVAHLLTKAQFDLKIEQLNNLFNFAMSLPLPLISACILWDDFLSILRNGSELNNFYKLNIKFIDYLMKFFEKKQEQALDTLCNEEK